MTQQIRALEAELGIKLPAHQAQAIRFNQTTLAIDAALMGQGVALVQEHFAAQDLDAGRLVQPLPEKLHTDAGYYLVHPRKQRHPEAVAQARQWFLQQAAQ